MATTSTANFMATSEISPRSKHCRRGNFYCRAAGACLSSDHRSEPDPAMVGSVRHVSHHRVEGRPCVRAANGRVSAWARMVSRFASTANI